MNITTIVTHPGPAHRDDFVSCCLLVATYEAKISRRKAKDSEMVDPEVLVLDQGGEHFPLKSNYDHHQFEREHAPACSISLILPLLGISEADAQAIWAWFEFTEVLDSKGPFVAASSIGVSPEGLDETHSPVEAAMLGWFSEYTEISPDSAIWRPLLEIGRCLLGQMEKELERLQTLRDSAERHDIEGVAILDVRCIAGDNNPQLGIETFIGVENVAVVSNDDRGSHLWLKNQVAVVVSNDDRGDGIALFRRKDDPRVDFSKIEGMGGVIFAHKGGFIAKLEAGVDPLPLIAKSLTS
jgi:hypothetical protein